MELIELACQKHPDVTTAEALVGLVYRLKQGIRMWDLEALRRRPLRRRTIERCAVHILRN